MRYVVQTVWPQSLHGFDIVAVGLGRVLFLWWELLWSLWEQVEGTRSGHESGVFVCRSTSNLKSRIQYKALLKRA